MNVIDLGTLLKKIAEELLNRNDIKAEYMPQTYGGCAGVQAFGAVLFCVLGNKVLDSRGGILAGVVVREVAEIGRAHV